VNRIAMGERFRPQHTAPVHRELLSQLFVSKLATNRTGILIDKLQVSKFMEKHVIKHKSANRKHRPFLTPDGPELLRRLPTPQGLREPHARWQSAQGDIPTSGLT
jgi:hypothetical protein